MGYSIQFKVLHYGMKKDKYHIEGDFDDSSSVFFQYERNIIHRINRFYFSMLKESQFEKSLECNWGMIIHESHLVLFALGSTKLNGKSYAYLDGLVFEKKDIHLVWLNVCEIIMMMKTKKLDGFIFEDDLCSLRKKRCEDIIPKEVYVFLRKDLVPKSFVYTNLVEEIWTQIKYIFYSMPIIEPKCSTIISKEDWMSDLKEYITEYNDRFEKYGNVNLEYEIPSIKKRPGKENYFKERKKIKEDIKNKYVSWRLHTISNNKHYIRRIEIPVINVNFSKMEGFFAEMLDRIDRGN